MANPPANYSVVARDPPCEIRDYELSVVALVSVEGSRSAAVNSGFRLLAGYIFGNNQTKTKIAMTAPVIQSSEPFNPPEPRAATLPTRWVVRFGMPDNYTLQSLPAPTDARVHFEQLPTHRVAVIQFSGFWSDSNLASHEEQLRRWMQSRQLTPAATASYAYYDPPWIPWFMRTIEVLIDVAPAYT